MVQLKPFFQSVIKQKIDLESKDCHETNDEGFLNDGYESNDTIENKALNAPFEKDSFSRNLQLQNDIPNRKNSQSIELSSLKELERDARNVFQRSNELASMSGSLLKNLLELKGIETHQQTRHRHGRKIRLDDELVETNSNENPCTLDEVVKRIDVSKKETIFQASIRITFRTAPNRRQKCCMINLKLLKKCKIKKS